MTEFLSSQSIKVGGVWTKYILKIQRPTQHLILCRKSKHPVISECFRNRTSSCGYYQEELINALDIETRGLLGRGSFGKTKNPGNTCL